MKESPLDALINMALDTRDEDWFNELVSVKYRRDDKAIALTNINCPYAVLEQDGIRRIKELGESEFCNGKLVKLKESFSKKGSIVQFEILSPAESSFIYGYYMGQYQNTYSPPYF